MRIVGIVVVVSYILSSIHNLRAVTCVFPSGSHDRAVLLYEYVGKKTVDLQHTEVPDAYRGRGIAKHLAKVKLQAQPITSQSFYHQIIETTLEKVPSYDDYTSHVHACCIIWQTFTSTPPITES